MDILLVGSYGSLGSGHGACGDVAGRTCGPNVRDSGANCGHSKTTGAYTESISTGPEF